MGIKGSGVSGSAPFVHRESTGYQPSIGSRVEVVALLASLLGDLAEELEDMCRESLRSELSSHLNV